MWRKDYEGNPATKKIGHHLKIFDNTVIGLLQGGEGTDFETRIMRYQK